MPAQNKMNMLDFDAEYMKAYPEKMRILKAYYFLCTVLFPLIGAIDYSIKFAVPSYDPTVRVLVYLACAGGIGGTIYGVITLIGHVARGDLNINFFWYYVYRPIVACLLGVFVYFLIGGALMILVKDASVPVGDTQRMMFYYALAFLIGFSANDVILKVRELARLVFRPVEAVKGEVAALPMATATVEAPGAHETIDADIPAPVRPFIPMPATDGGEAPINPESAAVEAPIEKSDMKGDRDPFDLLRPFNRN